MKSLETAMVSDATMPGNVLDRVSDRERPEPAADPQPRLVPARQVQPKSRGSFSTRTMSAITADAAKHHGTRVPTNRTIAWLLLGMDLLALATLHVCIGAFTGFFSQAWSAPFGYFIPLAIVLLGALSLIDGHRVEPTDPLGKADSRLFGTLVLASALGLGFAHAAGIWNPQSLSAIFADSVVITAGGFSILAMLNRMLIRGWLENNSARASWLLIARRDSEGLDQFWSDFRGFSAHGRLLFLAEPHSGVGRQVFTDTISSIPPENGDWHDLAKELAKPRSGIIVVDAPHLDEVTVRAVMQARLSGMPVISLERFYEQYWHRVPVFLLHHAWFALSRGFGILRSPIQASIKRAGDIILAGGLLVMASPVMALVAVLVKLDTPGPVLYRQARAGLGGRSFTCFKFRSMVTNADRGPLYAGKNDQRVTRFGRFIRSCRIDELPQLINILKGDMSFIGPRAMWTQIVDSHDREIPFFRLRHLVRPGLTGWAQVNFHYGGSSDDMRIKLEYDLWYIKHQSLFLDLWIVFRTVRVVLFGIGAQ